MQPWSFNNTRGTVAVAAAAQAGASHGLAIVVTGTSCAYTAATSSGRRRLRLQPPSSELNQAIAGTATNGDPIISLDEAETLSRTVLGAVGTQQAKATLLAAAVTTPGYDAAAGAQQMTVLTAEAMAVSTLPSLPPNALVPAR
jgi:hypothetical protein